MVTRREKGSRESWRVQNCVCVRERDDRSTEEGAFVLFSVSVDAPSKSNRSCCLA